MSYLVVTTFDVDSSQKRAAARVRSELKKLGLSEVLVDHNDAKHRVPKGTLVGVFEGANARSLRNRIRTQAREALERSRVRARLYVSVGAAAL
jgi:cytochrome P450